MLNHYQIGRFFDLRITDLCLSWHREAQFIQEGTVLDRFYVIRIGVTPDVLSAEEAVKAYKELNHVETAFRRMTSPTSYQKRAFDLLHLSAL